VQDSSPTSFKTERIIRGREVDELVGLSRSRRYELEAAGLFPRRRKLSDRASGYLASEIFEWIRTRPVASAGDE
jgi:prophage regulatory protein